MSLLDDKCDLCDSVCLSSPTAKANEMRLWCGECGLDRVNDVRKWLNGEGDMPLGREHEGTVINVSPRVFNYGKAAATLAAMSWWVMLILGAIHSKYPAVVNLPYWVVLLGLFGLCCVVSLLPATHYHDVEVDE